MQTRELLVSHSRDHLRQLRIFAEELFADVGSALGFAILIFAVNTLFHALEQQAGVVLREQRIPVAVPDDLDHVPALVVEDTFEFVDDLSISPYRLIQPLQVAVDDKDEVVELYARGDGECTQSLHLIGLAVSNESPNLARALRQKPAMLQITHEAGLINGVDGPDAHRDGGESPEVGH